MSTLKLPKTMKFKAPNPNELTLEAGLATNRHWILNVAWLLACPKSRTLGLTSLKTQIVKEQVRLVKHLLDDKTVHRLGAEEKLKSFDLTQYQEFSRDDIKFCKGYLNNKTSEKDIAYIKMQAKKTPNFFDIKYAACLFFDLSTKIFVPVNNDFWPLILKDASDKVVLALAPLSPNSIQKITREVD